MASYITKAGSAAMKAVEVVRTKAIPPAVEYYKATMAKNAEYVVKDPAAVDKLGKQLVYSNLARRVPRLARSPRRVGPFLRLILLPSLPRDARWWIRARGGGGRARRPRVVSGRSIDPRFSARLRSARRRLLSRSRAIDRSIRETDRAPFPSYSSAQASHDARGGAGGD